MLKQFGVETNSMYIHKYEALTPDSFIWKITLRDADKYTHYYLYAEDYVPSLDHVVKIIHENLASWSPNDAIKLIQVTKVAESREADTAKSTTDYQKAKRSEEFMKYAITSGIDFVFLARVTNRPNTNLD